MARANLNISESVNAEFLRAQEVNEIRFLKIKIEGESLELDSTTNSVGSVNEDFNKLLVDSLSEKDASFVLFRLDENSSSASSWMFLAWVPDGCKVRDKMLYSSSREDLKRSLGLGYFKSEYAANVKSDLTWEQYQNSVSAEFDKDILTDTERLMLEEKTLTQNEVTSTRSTAMGVMPFAMTPEVVSRLNDFKESKVNWVEMKVENETVELVHSGEVFSQKEVSQDQASFIAIRLSSTAGVSTTFFVFCCPENVHVKIKMTMSSSKASVLAAAQEQGVVFDRALEVRAVDEIDDLLSSELNGIAPGSSESSNAAVLSHSKPTRPGRGKAKVGKFVADSV